MAAFGGQLLPAVVVVARLAHAQGVELAVRVSTVGNYKIPLATWLYTICHASIFNYLYCILLVGTALFLVELVCTRTLTYTVPTLVVCLLRHLVVSFRDPIVNLLLFWRLH